MTNILMTKQGLNDLIREKEELLKVKIPAANDQLAKAREQGDLSENSAYMAAREEREFLSQRLDELDEMIKASRPVSKIHSDVVEVGSVVTLNTKKNDLVYTIVGEFESKPLEKKISYKSPLGSVLMGKKKGDTVEFITASSKTFFKIVKVD